MKKNEIKIPSTLGEGEKIEFLKVAAEFWKNYLVLLENWIGEERKHRRGDEGERGSRA